MTTVTGHYLLPTGDPANGYIKFQLWPEARDIDGAQRVCEPVYAVLDPSSGSFTIDLVPDADLVDVDGDAVYQVTEYVEACRRPAWYLHLADDTAVDLPSRYPGDANAPGAVLPLPGPQGPQGPQGEVAVDSTITGAPGTQALVEDLDPEDTAALLRFTIPAGHDGQDGEGLGDHADGLLSEAVWRVDAGELTDTRDGLADLSGNGRDALFGTGAAAPVVLDHDGDDYVHVPSAGQGVQITTTGALPYTATDRDGATVTGTTASGAWLFDTPGDWAEVRTDDGAYILDPSQVVDDHASIPNTGTAGGDWTVYRSSAGFRTAVVTRPTLLFGGAQEARVNPFPTDAMAQGGTVVFASRFTLADGKTHRMLELQNGGSLSDGLAIHKDSGAVLWATFKQGGTDYAPYYSQPPIGQSVVMVRVDPEGPLLDATFNDTPFPSGPRVPSPPPWANESHLVIGETRGGERVWAANMEFHAAALFDRALSDDEVATVSGLLTGERGPHPEYALQSESVPPSHIWAAGTEDASPLVTAYDPTVGRLAIGGVEMGDTGARRIGNAAMENGWAELNTSTAPFLRRVGNVVTLEGQWDASAATAAQAYTLPEGFRPILWGHSFVNTDSSTAAYVGQSDVRGSGVVLHQLNYEGNAYRNLNAAWTTDDPWPTTLPGTPA